MDQRMNVREQFKNQVFKPGHILPTMSIEEFADMEIADCMVRQEKDDEYKKQREEEDPESEEVLERERYKTTEMENWKDANPKG